MEPLTPANPAPFARIAIVGVGLIGGSIARAVRRRWPEVELTGFDRRQPLPPASVIPRWAGGYRELAAADLVVLATPVHAILEQLAVIRAADCAGVVIDVGSTKRAILDRAADLRLDRFVGTHPLAGAEHGGFESSREDLFVDRPWLIVPAAAAVEADVERVERFVEGLGGRPRRVTAAVHDRHMAYVSHVPQLVAVALMNAAGRAGGGAALDVSGRGFADMTRLASSPPDIWRAILATNADFIEEALNALRDELPADATAARDRQWIDAAFNEARDWQDRVSRGGP